MNIIVLSRDATLYSTSRLILEGKQRGHHIQVVDSLKCYIDIQTRTPRVIFQGKSLDYVDAVIPRVGTFHSFYGMTVVRQFQMMNVFCVNSSQAIARSRDKLRSMQILSKAGCNLPRTGFAHSIKDMDGLVDLVGGAPLVIKILEGTQGLGVVLAETKQVATSIMEAFRSLDVNILVQEYIKESEGADIRAFVVGSKVVAAMERRARPGDFRANVHRGGSASKIKLTAEERRLAIKAAKTLGLNVAGVDLLRSKRGPLVIEVNSSPGLEGIESTTKVNVAARIYDYIEENVSKKVTKDDA